VEEAILAEGPTPWPRSSWSRCRTPRLLPAPPGYFERLREICDRHDVLLVSDEVICAFGRIGSMFACDDFGYVPDIITCAKA
jgi:adenosylmethionine-8-amino-7-oxononanoate aminotransferase